LTDSGRFTHKVVKQPSISLAQDMESSPTRTDVLTTMLRHQQMTTTLPAYHLIIGINFYHYFSTLSTPFTREPKIG